MIRGSLNDLPAAVLPDGCKLRTYETGDDLQWQRIIGESFGGDLNRFSFQNMVASRPFYRPECVFFITLNGIPVATASAVRDPESFPGYGVIHYVGVSPSAQGRQLGYRVCLAALLFIRDEELKGATLLTDDFRLPALKTYFRLGFGPLLVAENQRERWPEVFRKLGMEQLLEQYRTILEGPVWSPGEPIPVSPG